MDARLIPFKNKFREEIAVFMQRFLSEVKNEKVFAIAFVTDDFFETLYCVLNTEEKFQQYLIDHPDYARYKGQKWAANEWGYGDNNLEDSPFGSFYEILRKLSQELDLPYNMHDERKQKFIKAFIEAIAEGVLSIPDKVFTENNQIRENIIFFVSISDNNYTETLEDESAKLMNNKDIYNNFLTRYDK